MGKYGKNETKIGFLTPSIANTVFDIFGAQLTETTVSYFDSIVVRHWLIDIL